MVNFESPQLEQLLAHLLLVSLMCLRQFFKQLLKFYELQLKLFLLRPVLGDKFLHTFASLKTILLLVAVDSGAHSVDFDFYVLSWYPVKLGLVDPG